MYLKNLTVFGFKSFADKTALNFQPGVTAIVGPNGCGKSNVSDAIRWVLGEQSAKALRGGEMADVIFNGTDGRKPMGMGEVSLTLGGVGEESLRAAGVEVAYDEVTLTRRIFRDGNSEYFLNRTPCRLKDIQQLFMGTGVGRTSYSILAQGHITQILSSKPEDRRMIFEEAAGITKFKSQKKRIAPQTGIHGAKSFARGRPHPRSEAADRLAPTPGRQGAPLQTDFTRNCSTSTRSLRGISSTCCRRKFPKSRPPSKNCGTKSNRVPPTCCGLKTKSRKLRERLSELEHEVAAQQQRGLELKGEMDRHESRIQFNEERLRELASQNAKALADITQAEERCRAAQEESAAVAEKLSASEAALAQHRRTLEAKQRALAKVEEDLKQRQEALREAQAAAFAAAQDLTRIRNEITALDLQKQGNVVRLEKLSAEKIQLEEERTRLEARLQEFTASVEVEKLNAQTKRGSVEQRQNRLREFQMELQAVLRRAGPIFAAAGRETLAPERARAARRFARRLQRGRAGGLAPVALGHRLAGRPHSRAGTYVVAIENALGHHLQLVLTEQPESAQQILADLSANKIGRASVAALAIGIPTKNNLRLKAKWRRAADSR